jgi:hypothetical protein
MMHATERTYWLVPCVEKLPLHIYIYAVFTVGYILHGHVIFFYYFLRVLRLPPAGDPGVCPFLWPGFFLRHPSRCVGT